MDHETRRKVSRIFAIAVVTAFAMWGVDRWQKHSPQDVVLRYEYRDIPTPEKLGEVQVEISSKEGFHARVNYFHPHGMSAKQSQQFFQKQTLKLNSGAYTLRARLLYKDGRRQRLLQRLNIRESGTYYVRFGRTHGAYR